MTRDEHKQNITKLIGLVSPDNQATASEILANLSEDYEKVLSDSEGASETIKKLTENNETLRAVNSKLFLKVGEVPKEPATPTEPQGEPEIPAISFESLFNDKGDLI